MSTSDPGGGLAQLGSLQYPQEQDQKIRAVASFIGADGIIVLLDKLRVFVAGDLAKVFHLADVFAQEGKLAQASEKINDAQLVLATAWHGDAADQFDKYAGFATAALTKGQASLVSLASTMSKVATAVIETYKQLIGFIGKCALNLAQAETKLAWLAVAALFPPAGGLQLKDIVDTVNNAFMTFWNDCLNALTALITNIGNLAAAGIDFSAIKTNFAELPEVGVSADVIDDPGRWRVKPGADPA